jgi:hypothetical protein
MVKLIAAFLQLVVANVARNYCRGWRKNRKRIFLYVAILAIQSLDTHNPTKIVERIIMIL